MDNFIELNRVMGAHIYGFKMNRNFKQCAEIVVITNALLRGREEDIVINRNNGYNSPFPKLIGLQQSVEVCSSGTTARLWISARFCRKGTG